MKSFVDLDLFPWTYFGLFSMLISEKNYVEFHIEDLETYQEIDYS